MTSVSGRLDPERQEAVGHDRQLRLLAEDAEVKAGSKITVKKPGTYAYHCNIHNSMKGTYRGELKGDLMGEAKAN